MKKATVILAISSLFLVPALAFAQPPQLPQLFWGNVTIDGSPIPVGTVITATNAGLQRGSVTVGQLGVYGGSGAFDQKLMVQGDIQGDISFVTGSLTAAQTAPFASGVITNLDLAFTTPPAPAGGGGGGDFGGGGGGVFPGVPGPVITLGPSPSVPQGQTGGTVGGAVGGTTGGQVLGAVTFRFNQNLGQGSRGDDVLELQKRLQSEGVYQGPLTGYFGPLTAAGVKAYQAKKGVLNTGFMGPLTRAELNKSEGPAAQAPLAPMTSAQRESLIKEIQGKIQALLAEVLKLLAAQTAQITAPVAPATPAPTPAPSGGGGGGY